MADNPPDNWDDSAAWNRYFTAELGAGRTRAPDPMVYRFLSYARGEGGRIWFPGCGLDAYPKAYAEQGCRVLATDLSSVAVGYQRGLADEMQKDGTANIHGRLDVAVHDFTTSRPEGEFDLVINRLAFQGLSSPAMRAAAENFYAALRPGGASIIDTMNVQGEGEI